MVCPAPPPLRPADCPRHVMRARRRGGRIFGARPAPPAAVASDEPGAETMTLRAASRPGLACRTGPGPAGLAWPGLARTPRLRTHCRLMRRLDTLHLAGRAGPGRSACAINHTPHRDGRDRVEDDLVVVTQRECRDAAKPKPRGWTRGPTPCHGSARRPDLP